MLQKAPLLKREVEVNCVTAQFIAKRQEIKARMEAASQWRAELAAKHNKMQASFSLCARRGEPWQEMSNPNYQAEVDSNEMTEGEKNKLVAELAKLRVRQQKLESKVAKYKACEDFLLKPSDKLPDSDCGACPKMAPEHMLAWEHGDPVVRAIIRKHETHSATNRNLIKNLVILSDDYQKSQHDLEALLWEHDTTKIIMLLSKLFMVYRAAFRSTESHHLKIKFFVVLNATLLQETLRAQSHM
ncbi:LOW QUALITY PROTEIN: uncharacterized protein CCDC197 [Phoenicopterus ruber ruber]